jgi:hypothetical protein
LFLSKVERTKKKRPGAAKGKKKEISNRVTPIGRDLSLLSSFFSAVFGLGDLYATISPLFTSHTPKHVQIK